MKKTFARSLNLLMLSFLLFFIAACSSPTESTPGASSEEKKDAGYRRYRIESGVVEYTISGSQTGTETLYFDKYGMREAKYTNTEISTMGITQKTNQMTLMDGEWIYNVDLDKRTGTKMKNPLFEMIADKSDTKDFGEMGMQMLKEMGGEKVGSEEIAGKLCDVWESKDFGSKSWIWNSLTLKTEVNMAGLAITSLATKVDEGASIPDDKFTVPSDVKITEEASVNEMMEKMKKGMKK